MGTDVSEESCCLLLQGKRNVLKMEVEVSSETPVNICKITRCFSLQGLTCVLYFASHSISLFLHTFLLTLLSLIVLHIQILFCYTNREQAGVQKLPADLGQHVFCSCVVSSMAHLCSVTILCRLPF